MAWKTNDNGSLFVNEAGNPVFIQDSDNTEHGVDYEAIIKKLTANAADAKKSKDAMRAAQAEIAPLKEAGIADIRAYMQEKDDIEAAYKALKDTSEGKGLEEQIRLAKETVEKSFKGKEDGYKSQLAEFQKRLDLETKERERVTTLFKGENIARLFQDSSFIKDKCMLPPDIMRAIFSAQCEIDENGSFVGKDDSGEVVYGADGKPANFEEFISKAVKAHKNGETTILKGSNMGGAGGAPINTGGSFANPWLKTSFSVTEQMKIVAANPERANALKAAAIGQ
jgi:hypothetical protein